EHWFPVNNLGGAWDEATHDAALRVHLEGNRAVINANVNARFSEALFTVESGSLALRSERVKLDPTKPFSATIELPPATVGHPLTVTLKTKEGRELIKYRTD